MILVFAAKPLGAAAFSFLVGRGDPVARVVVASEADSEILDTCRQLGIPAEIWVEDTVGRLTAGRSYSWLLNLYSPRILPPAVLALAAQRANLHSAPVPSCRGNDNAAWILRSGATAGVSILEMGEGVDTGGIWAERRVEATFPITGAALNARLKDELLDLFRLAWPAMLAGSLVPHPQRGEARSFTRRQTEADRRLPETARMTLGEAVTWILAHDFHPGTTAEMVRGESRWSLRIQVSKIA